MFKYMDCKDIHQTWVKEYLELICGDLVFHLMQVLIFCRFFLWFKTELKIAVLIGCEFGCQINSFQYEMDTCCSFVR